MRSNSMLNSRSKTRRISIVFAMAFLFSCKHGNTGEHLSPDAMQKVLLDISLAESYSVQIKDSVHRGSIKNTDTLSVFYKTIFDHHKITADQLKNSLEWYKQHPGDLDSVYAKMIPIATRWQNSAPPPPPPVRPAVPVRDTTLP